MMDRACYSRRIPQILLRLQAEQLINNLNSSQKIPSNAEICQYREIKKQIQLILKNSTMSTDNEDDLKINYIGCVFKCTICGHKFELFEDAIKNHYCKKKQHSSIDKQLPRSEKEAKAGAANNAMPGQNLANEEMSTKNEVETNVDQQVEHIEIVDDNIPDNMDHMQTAKKENSNIELATNGNEYKTIIRIEVDSFTKSLFNVKSLHKCIGKDNIEDFEQMKKQINEILDTSPTVKVYVDTYGNQMVHENNNCSRRQKSLNLVQYNKAAMSANNSSKKVLKRPIMRDLPKEKKKKVNVISTLLNKGTRKFVTNKCNYHFTSLLKDADNIKYGKYIGAIEKAITPLIEKIFPDESVDIYCFGSRLYGIGTAQSDLDIYIDIGHTLYNFEEFPSIMTLDKLRKVQRAMRKTCEDDNDLENFEALREMRFPTLRVKHGKLHCKLHFSNILGKTNTILLQYLFELQPIARAMCLYLKEWMQRALKNIDMNTYSLSLMVVFYLQNLNVLPSIQKLQRSIDHQKAVMVGPWICSYVPLTPQELDMWMYVDSLYDNCLELVRGFFDFYIHFNYETEVICPYWGRTLNKNELNSFMPHWYTSYVASSSCDLDLKSPITLQDPIQLNHNVMENLTMNHFITFKNVMCESFELMCKTPK